MNNILTAYLPKSTPSMETHSSFGVATAERSWSGDYRYGFNGQEKEPDLFDPESCNDYGERIYEARLGKFLSIDYYVHKFPNISPYSFANNSPIVTLDARGDSVWVYSESLGSARGNGRHMFMRVKTDREDVVIELYGPKGGATGRPQVNQYTPNALKRQDVNEYVVVRPIDSPEGDYKFENMLIELGSMYRRGNEYGPTGPGENEDVVSNEFLPEYNMFGPNSNGYVASMIKYAKGELITSPMDDFSILPGKDDQDDLSPYLKQMAKWCEPSPELMNDHDLKKVDLNTAPSDKTATKYDSPPRQRK